MLRVIPLILILFIHTPLRAYRVHHIVHTACIIFQTWSLIYYAGEVC